MIRLCSLVAVALAALIGSPASAAYSLTTLTLTENFDGLPNSGAAQTVASSIGSQGLLSGTGFEGTYIAGSGGSTGNLALTVGTGTNNVGSLYSFGATNSTERALGTLASGSFTSAFGAQIINNTGATLTSFTLSFNREQWRSSTAEQNVVAFAYGVSGGAITAANFLTADLLEQTSLDLVGLPPVAPNGALDGNANAVQVAGTINVTVAAGQSLFLRWTDADDAGNDAGLAIDNFRLVATPGGTVPIPEPASVALTGIGLAGALAYARRLARRP